MNARQRESVLRHAAWLLREGFGLDTGMYVGEVVEDPDTDVRVCDVVFTRPDTGLHVRVTEIRYAEDGAVLQSGSNYGGTDVLRKKGRGTMNEGTKRSVPRIVGLAVLAAASVVLGICALAEGRYLLGGVLTAVYLIAVVAAVVSIDPDRGER